MITESDLAHEVPEEIADYTIAEATACGELDFYLPVQWGVGDGLDGPSVEDPLTIYASWDINGCDERVTFTTTLRKMILAAQELHGDYSGVVDEEGIEVLERIRRGLEHELKYVDELIKKAKNEQTIPPSDLHAEDV